MTVGRCISGETLSAFADGELAPVQLAEVQQHLRSCENCSLQVAAFTQLDHVLSGSAALSCASVSTLLSAESDGELVGAEAALLAAHTATCESCAQVSASWGRVDLALAALPAGMPSARVDAAVRALVDHEHVSHRPLHAPMGLRLAATVAVIAAVAVVGALAQSDAPAVPQVAQRAPDAPVLRAAVQQSALNGRTNILYVLRPDSGSVAALDGTIHTELAVIQVGGRPTALALNEATNTVLVLDSARKTVTEIDGASNTVTATVDIPVAGTPTSIQVDQQSGNVVVASVTAPAPATVPAANPSVGAVTVLNGANLALETTRSVTVAPRLVVLDPSGKRALLVSGEATTLVDGTTYRDIAQFPGGVAAAFAARGTGLAVLSDSAAGAVLTMSGDAKTTVSIGGKPLALVALPDGGFAVLLDVNGAGKITTIAANGAIGVSQAVALTGHDLSYDAATKHFTVAGSTGVSFAAAAPAAPQPVSGLTPTPSPAPTSAPTGSVPAVASPSAPNASAPKPLSVDPHSLLSSATLAWQGTYRFELPSAIRPAVVGRGGDKLWFVDQHGNVERLDPLTGRLSHIAELPADAKIRSLLVGANYVYAIDGTTSRVFLISLTDATLTTPGLPFVKENGAVTLTPDDKLWFAVANSGQVLTLDPRTHVIEATNIGNFDVTALTSDIAGRVWIADARRKAVELYNPSDRSVIEYALPVAGATNQLKVDGNGTLWVATSTGEVLGIHNGVLVSTRDIGNGVSSLVTSSDGSVWFTTAGATRAYGSVTSLQMSLGLPSMTGLWLDKQGKAWLADSSSAAFYITVENGH